MAEAITVAEQTIPGKPVHVEMGKDLGHTVYQVEIVDKDNKSRWVYVDATVKTVIDLLGWLQAVSAWHECAILSCYYFLNLSIRYRDCLPSSPMAV